MDKNRFCSLLKQFMCESWNGSGGYYYVVSEIERAGIDTDKLEEDIENFLEKLVEKYSGDGGD